MLTTLLVIVILGVAGYFVEKIPMHPYAIVLFRVLVILIIVFYLLSLVGVTTVPARLRL